MSYVTFPPARPASCVTSCHRGPSPRLALPYKGRKSLLPQSSRLWSNDFQANSHYSLQIRVMEVLTKFVHSRGNRQCVVKLTAERDALLAKEHKLAQEIQCIKTSCKYWHAKGQVMDTEATETKVKALEKKRQQINSRLVSLGRQLLDTDAECKQSYSEDNACDLSSYSPASACIPLNAHMA